MKRAVIIHCWDGVPDYCWYPYLKNKLEEKEFEVEVPEFPDTQNPKLDAWLKMLTEKIGKPNEELYLIGHSLGCITIMRYLESLKDNQKIGGVVFVAGFSENIGYDEIQSFFETSVDLEKIKSKSKNGFAAIFSDNDPYVDLKYADIFKEKLEAEVIIKSNMGHFSGAIEGEKSCLELPEALEAVEKLAK